MRLAHTLLVLVRDIRLAVVNRVAYVRFVFEHCLDLIYCPRTALFFRSIGVNVGKCPVARVIEPTGSRHLLFYELVSYARGSCTVERHIENLFDDPLGVLVNDKGVFPFRVTLVPERSISENSLTVCKLGVQRGLDLAACVFRKPLIE